MKFASLLAVYCSANFQVGTLQSRAPARPPRRTAAIGNRFSIGVRGPKRYILPTFGLPQNHWTENRGSTLHFLRSANKLTPLLKDWGGSYEKVCARAGIFSVCAARAFRAGGSRYSI